jgi:hypothetical protein
MVAPSRFALLIKRLGLGTAFWAQVSDGNIDRFAIGFAKDDALAFDPRILGLDLKFSRCIGPRFRVCNRDQCNEGETDRLRKTKNGTQPKQKNDSHEKLSDGWMRTQAQVYLNAAWVSAIGQEVKAVRARNPEKGQTFKDSADGVCERS